MTHFWGLASLTVFISISEGVKHFDHVITHCEKRHSERDATVHYHWMYIWSKYLSNVFLTFILFVYATIILHYSAINSLPIIPGEMPDWRIIISLDPGALLCSIKKAGHIALTGVWPRTKILFWFVDMWDGSITETLDPNKVKLTFKEHLIYKPL